MKVECIQEVLKMDICCSRPSRCCVSKTSCNLLMIYYNVVHILIIVLSQTSTSSLHFVQLYQEPHLPSTPQPALPWVFQSWHQDAAAGIAALQMPFVVKSFLILSHGPLAHTSIFQFLFSSTPEKLPQKMCVLCIVFLKISIVLPTLQDQSPHQSNLVYQFFCYHGSMWPGHARPPASQSVQGRHSASAGSFKDSPSEPRKILVV